MRWTHCLLTFVRGTTWGESMPAI